jgi:CRP-like cAMP-binding protein
MMRSDILLVNFLDLISNRSQFLSEKIKFLNFKTIKGKLAHYILQKCTKENSFVILGMTQNDLADFFGVTRPSVARALGELEAQGYIEAKGRNIKILNRKGLEELITD